MATLYLGQDVLIPITLAAILSFILSPVVNLLQRVRLWRAAAVFITVLTALGLIGGIATLMGTQAASLSVNAPQYAAAIDSKVKALQDKAVAQIKAISRELGTKRKPARAPVSAIPSGRLSDAATAVLDSGASEPVRVQVIQSDATPLQIVSTVLAPIIGPLETTFIVVIVAIFVLMQKEDLRDRFIRVLGSGDLHRTTLALDDAGKRLSRYFLAQLGLNATFGLIVGIGLWLFGVPSPALWGVLAGLCRFVPYIGAVLAAVGPVALGLAIDPGWSTAIYIVLFFVITESVLGYVVEPLLYGHSTGLSPLSVIVAAIFWTWLWGPIGLIISTPVTLCLVVLGRHVKALEVFDVMLGDRPALTAVEGFYQRVLADNPDEALAQAEAMLVDRDLTAYYDEVVLQALKLAALDEARGTIDGARVQKMTRTMLEVIGDLSGHIEADVALATMGASKQVACVAGRGPFDDAVATMLAQVLERRGFVARVVPHQSASREEIARLDLVGVEVIVVSYLELTGSPAQLRFLIRRLRQVAPHALIIVGLWPEGEAALTDSAIQAALGADKYVGSIRAAVDAIAQRQLLPPA